MMGPDRPAEMSLHRSKETLDYEGFFIAQPNPEFNANTGGVLHSEVILDLPSVTYHTVRILGSIIPELIVIRSVLGIANIKRHSSMEMDDCLIKRWTRDEGRSTRDERRKNCP